MATLQSQDSVQFSKLHSVRIWKYALLVLAGVFALLGVAIFVAWWLAKPRLSALFSSLATMQNANGITTQPTQGGIRGALSRLPFIAGFFELCAVALILYRVRLAEFFADLPGEWRQTRAYLRRQFPSGPETWIEISGVAATFVLGLFLRLWHIGRAIRYDEAATYLNFASKPFYRALSNYSYPNNHLLNTLLARLSLLTFGDSTFALRLPALLGGCAAILMAWWTGRVLYDRWTGILAAGCVASLPAFVEYSVNGRGYSLQWVCVLGMMTCSAVLLERPRSKMAWLGFVVAAVAGLYALPTMVMPILGCGLWLVLAGWNKGGLPASGELLHRLWLAGLSLSFAAVLLYVPPLLSSGPAAVLSNRFVTPQSGGFFAGLGLLGHSTWIRWSDGVPATVVYLLAAGVVLGLVFAHGVGPRWAPMTLVLWLTGFGFAWARNILGYPRVWNYLLLAGVLTAAAGLAAVIQRVVPKPWGVAVASVLSVGLALSVGASLLRQRILFRTNETAALANVEEVIQYLCANTHSGDALVIGHPGTPIVEYELLRGCPKVYAGLVPLEKAQRVIVVLPKPEAESESYRTEELWARLRVEDAVDPSAANEEMDLKQFAPPRLLAKLLSGTIYSFERNSRSGP